MIDGSDSQPSGPDFEQLRKLKDMLPSMIEQHSQGKLTGKGRRVPRQKPRKMCRVCCKGWEFINTTDDVAMSAGICPDCEPHLKECIALVCGDKYAFAKPHNANLQDLVGKIIELSPANFEKMENTFKLQARIRSRSKPIVVEPEPPDANETPETDTPSQN